MRILYVLGAAAALGLGANQAAPRATTRGISRREPRTQPNREIEHYTSSRPLTKRQRRRQRGKAKAAQHG